MVRKIVFTIVFAFTILNIVACEPNDQDKSDGNVDITLTLLAGKDTLVLNDNWQDAGVLVESENNTQTILTTDTVDTSVPGLKRVSYIYTFRSETFTKERYIMVLDAKIMIELNPGVDTIKKGETWEDAGVTLNQDREVNIEGFVNINQVGSYEITYSTLNYLGEVISVTRIVNVIE